MKIVKSLAQAFIEKGLDEKEKRHAVSEDYDIGDRVYSPITEMYYNVDGMGPRGTSFTRGDGIVVDLSFDEEEAMQFRKVPEGEIMTAEKRTAGGDPGLVNFTAKQFLKSSWADKMSRDEKSKFVEELQRQILERYLSPEYFASDEIMSCLEQAVTPETYAFILDDVRNTPETKHLDPGKPMGSFEEEKNEIKEGGVKMGKAKDIVMKRTASKRTAGEIPVANAADNPKDIFTPAETVCVFPVELFCEDVMKTMRAMKGSMDVKECFKHVIAMVSNVTPEWEKAAKDSMKAKGFEV